METGGVQQGHLMMLFRSLAKAIGINVEHTPHFQCRCGHQPCGPHWPPFPQSVECDDAPVANVLPEDWLWTGR